MTTRCFQLPSHTSTGEIFQEYLSAIRFHCSTFVEIEHVFLKHEAMINFNLTQDSRYDSKKLANHSIWRPPVDFISNCDDSFKDTVSFVDMVHFNAEYIVIYVECDGGSTF